MSKKVDLPQQACVREDLVGNIYSVQGRRYVLDEQGLVFDLGSQELIHDEPIIDEVYRHLEEEKAQAQAIRAKAKQLSAGDPVLEEMLRIHFAFSGIHDLAIKEPQSEAA